MEDGIILLENVEDQEIILPAADDKWMLHKDTQNAPLPDQQAASKSTQRKGKGAHALSVAKELISDRANWYNIESSDDYNFPGISLSHILNALVIAKTFQNYTMKPATPIFFIQTSKLGKVKLGQNV